MKILVVMFGLMLMAVMATVAFAEDLRLTVESVEVEGFELSESGDNVRNLERGEEFDVKIFLKANPPVRNALDTETTDIQVYAFISGMEFNDKTSDETRAFDLDAGHSVVKTLTLNLPERVDEDTYLLRILIADRNSDSITHEYYIKVEPTDAEVVIKDFEISPENKVMAGRAILATVRVRNLGDSEEDDVKIRVSIPGLGVSATPDFIDELEDDESATSEEFFLKIDRCAKPGIYEIVAEVTFDEGDETTTQKKSITVTKGNCNVGAPTQKPAVGRTIIAYNTESQTLMGGAEVSYPITITNTGGSTKVFMLSVDSADWADFEVSGSNLVSVGPGTTQTVFVSATATVDAMPGKKVFTVNVKDSTGKVLKTLVFKAEVSAPAVAVDAMPGLRTALTSVLVVIVAILVIVGLVLAFRRVRGGSDGESQTYY